MIGGFPCFFHYWKLINCKYRIYGGGLNRVMSNSGCDVHYTGENKSEMKQRFQSDDSQWITGQVIHSREGFL